DNEIASLMETSVPHTTAIPEFTSDFTTTTPPPPPSDNQKNLYNALVESYNFDKDIITSYGDVVLLRRGQDDQDKDEDPFVGSDRGTKRRKFGKEAESSKDLRSKEKKYSSTYKDASQSPHKSSSKYAHVEEPSHTVEDSDMQQDQ
nr:hypothetical protein [Tanacetum cinerariifolium]